VLPEPSQPGSGQVLFSVLGRTAGGPLLTARSIEARRCATAAAAATAAAEELGKVEVAAAKRFSPVGPAEEGRARCSMAEEEGSAETTAGPEEAATADQQPPPPTPPARGKGEREEAEGVGEEQAEAKPENSGG